jgi:hypothetical protein
MASGEPEKPFQFLELPLECRQLIYGHVIWGLPCLEKNFVCTLGARFTDLVELPRRSLPLFAVSKKVSTEALPVFIEHKSIEIAYCAGLVAQKFREYLLETNLLKSIRLLSYNGTLIMTEMQKYAHGHCRPCIELIRSCPGLQRLKLSVACKDDCVHASCYHLQAATMLENDLDWLLDLPRSNRLNHLEFVIRRCNRFSWDFPDLMAKFLESRLENYWRGLRRIRVTASWETVLPGTFFDSVTN